MSELTIGIEWTHKELKEYLLSLNGISYVEIRDNEEQIDVYLKYNSTLITPKIIKIEILLFMDSLKTPSILYFDKHSKTKTLTYTIVRDKFCCEYCFKGAVQYLLEIEGIEKVESNFNEAYDKSEKIIINIQYDPNLITSEKMKQIELELDI